MASSDQIYPCKVPLMQLPKQCSSTSNLYDSPAGSKVTYCSVVLVNRIYNNNKKRNTNSWTAKK